MKCEHAAEEGVKILPDVVGIRNSGASWNLIPPLSGSQKANSSRTEWHHELAELLSEYGPAGTFWKQHTTYAKYAPRCWEIWNEPNYGARGAFSYKEPNALVGPIDTSRYGELLGIAREAFSDTDPGAHILFGGLLTVGKYDPRDRMQSPHMPLQTFIKRVGHYEDYDALSLHPYAFTAAGNKRPSIENMQTVTTKVEEAIALARRTLETVRGGKARLKKPIWITEIGWPVEGNKAHDDKTHLLVSEKVQAGLLKSSFEMVRSRAERYDVEKLLYYNAEDNTQLSGQVDLAEAKKMASAWENRTGLVEDVGGYGEENGERREAWKVFKEQVEK